MVKRRVFLQALAATGMAASAAARPEPGQPQSGGGTERAYWLGVLKRLAEPVLVNLSEQRLRERMPVEASPGAEADRRNYTHLEAFGRLLAGISPGLELGASTGEEGQLRDRYAALAPGARRRDRSTFA